MTTLDKQWKSHGMRSPREACNATADFVVEDRVNMGIVKDKSDSGVYMEAMGSFSVGQELTLTFMPPGARKPTKRKGRIVRITSTGFGVEFD